MIGTIAGILIAVILAIYDLYYHRCNYVSDSGRGNSTMESYMSTYLGNGELQEDITSQEVSREYNRYIYVQRILNETPGHNSYEKRNSVERLLLAMSNLGNSADPVFATIPTDHEIYKQFIVEMQSKNKVNINPEYIANIISQYFASSPKPIMFTITSGKFQCGTYSREIAPERMQLLLKLGGDNAVATMLMRYASILPGSQHWNLPLDTYKHLYAEGFRIEGFASPVNSQMLLCADGTSGELTAKFCSLFPDVDAPFGSIGSFFPADLAGNNVVVNPPYIESIFIAVGKKLTAECERAEATLTPTRFFVTFAAWRDSKGYLELLNSKYTRLAVILPAGSHYYGNTNAVVAATGGSIQHNKFNRGNKHLSHHHTHTDNTKIVAKFDTAIFELIAGYSSPPPELDLEKLLATNQADANIKHERLV